MDVEAFEEAAATARRAHKTRRLTGLAIELYAGELLPEDRYEEWAEGRREELRRQYLALLVELASLYEERGEHEAGNRGAAQGHDGGAHSRGGALRA